MAADQPSDARQRQSATFSLRGLLLFVTSAGVASVAFRVAGNGAERVALAMFLVGLFLTLCFFVTQQFKAMRASVALFAFGLLFSMLLPAVRSGSGPRRSDPCLNNLKQIGIALLSYHQQYGSFPPAFVADANGKPLYSWRALILPFMDQTTLANSIHSDEAWDGSNNAKVTSTPVATFHCPGDLKSPPTCTSYVAVVGPHSAWSGAKPRKLSDFKNPSATILVVEIANSGIHWAEPRDLYTGEMAPGVNPRFGQGISSDHPAAFHALFADGSIHDLSDSIDPKTLAELLDLDGCSDPSAYQ